MEQDAGALIQHGDYILRRIYETRQLNRWLSGNDILAFVKDKLCRNFDGCSIEASPPGSDTYRIILSPTAREELANFISRRRLQGTTQLLKDDHKRRYRFTSSVAKQVNGQIEHISQLHTLVRFAVELDEHNESTRQAEPVVASVRQDKLPIQCAPGAYVIGIRSWLANTAGDRANSIARIAYVGALLDKSKLISPEDAEAMTGTAAEYGYLLPNFAHDERLPASSIKSYRKRQFVLR